MAEDHRRVESRQIVGSGMATDPERIQKVADEAARRERAWRPAPEVGFGDVLGRAPARGELADEPPSRDAADDSETADASTAPVAPPDATPTKPPTPPRMLRATPRAPDPRQAALHRQLEQSRATVAPSKAPTESTETPPTGTAGARRTPR